MLTLPQSTRLASGAVGGGAANFFQTLGFSLDGLDGVGVQFKREYRNTLDAMISEGIEEAVLAKFFCGLYSGKHFHKINRDLPALVELVLREPFRGLTRGH